MDEELEKIKEDIKQKDNEVVSKENTAMQAFDKFANTDTSKVIQAMQNKEVVDIVDTDEDIHNQLKKNAKEMVTTHTDTMSTKIKKENQQAKFDANKSACDVYGVSNSCPLWQQNLMVIGSNIWFIVYFIIATLIIAPISVFTIKLSNIFKHGWVALLVGILTYLFIAVGMPLLITLL